MFLYGIGILYGREFFEGMSGVGRKYNLLALVACIAGLFVALGLGHVFGIKLGHTLGIYAGSMTSTATLQAALDVMGNGEPSVGYSIAYPFGVIGPILCIYFMARMVKPKFPPKSQRFHMGEIILGDNCSGRSLSDLSKELPPGVQVTMVETKIESPSDDIILASGDGLMLVAEQEGALAQAAAKPRKPGARADRQGSLQPRLHPGLRRQSKCGRCAAGAARAHHRRFPINLLHVRRYHSDLVPSPDLTLKYGDRVGVLMPPDRKEEVRRYFGDTVKSAAEFSYVSLGLGMVLGLLLGLIPIPIPGVGTVTLGVGGGPLIVALILGKLRRTGPLLWVMPLPANIVLRSYGLAIFLAAVVINAGQPFVRTLSKSGLTMLFIGAAVLLTTVLIVLVVGYLFMKIPLDDLLGVASGATGNPAILVYAARMAPTERPDIGYAMIFPSMTIVKVIAVQMIGILFGVGPG